MRLTFVFLAVAAAAFAASEPVSGVVLDAAGAAIPGARLTLSTAQQSGAGAVESGPDGRFRFSGVQPERYVLTAEKAGFSPARVVVRVGAGRSDDITVTLAIQPIASEVTVTAETGLVGNAFEIAQPVNLVDRAEIDQRVHTVALEALREEPGVDIQRTVPVMGAAAVRGLLGKNVAVYRDGVRYTTSAQRGGVSTFFNLTEATSLDSVEVLRGPNSAQYGSDSLGGTINFLSRPASIGSSNGWSGEFAPAYSSASHTFGGNLLASYGGQRFGMVTNLAGRRQNTWRSGQGIESHAAVTRFLGLPSDILGERSTDTAFTQYGGMFHAQAGLSPRQQLVFHYERSQQDGGKRWDQLLGGDGNLIADLRNLMLDFGYARYTRFQAGPFDQVNATLSFNSQREERVNQGGNGNPAGAVTQQYERTSVWGTSLTAAKHWREHDFLIGADGYRETMRAPAFATSATGVTTLTRPRVPNGARELLYGVYAQESWSRGPVRIGGAIRFGGASYRSRAANSPIVNGQPLWPDDSLAANAVSGRIGIVYRIAAPVAAHFNYSRGFRAPSMTDLGTVGIQGNGFYEASYADLAGRGAFVGDRADDRAVSSGQPVAPARPETSDNYDFGVRVSAGRVRAAATGFIIDLGNTIVSQTLIMPQGVVGQPLGDQIINRQLPTGAVYVPAATAPVLARANIGGARFKGFEQSFEAQLTRAITLAENLTWIDATDNRSGMPPDIEGGIPPLTTNVRLRWSPAGSRFWVEGYTTLADRQDHLSSLALADRRTGATRSRANIQSFFNNGARVRGLVVNGILVPTGETLTQVQNRVLGAETSAPMFTAIAGYGLFGVRGGVRMGERSDLLLDWSNLFDKNYRGISWGIDGPGRSIAVKYRIRF
jgi:outer membrane receptor protein involved in Fe transport